MAMVTKSTVWVRDVQKPESWFGNRKSSFRGILKNRKPKLNSPNFSNVCLITEIFSLSSSTLQTVMFMTAYDW